MLELIQLFFKLNNKQLISKDNYSDRSSVSGTTLKDRVEQRCLRHWQSTDCETRNAWPEWHCLNWTVLLIYTTPESVARFSGLWRAAEPLRAHTPMFICYVKYFVWKAIVCDFVLLEAEKILLLDQELISYRRSSCSSSCLADVLQKAEALLFQVRSGWNLARLFPK